MTKICLNDLETACKNLFNQLRKFKDYVKYLETVPLNKLTAREKELVKKFGKKKSYPKAG